jgi:hypothetical protein
MINKCKHSAIYRVPYFEPNDEYILNGSYHPDMIKDSIKFKEYSYNDLDDEHRKEADEKQLNNSWMRCSEHCGNTVRKVQ